MSTQSTNERTDGALGCGFLLAIAGAIVAVVMGANVFHFLVGGALIGAAIGLFADPEATQDHGKAKSKRNDAMSHGARNGKSRKGKIVYGSPPANSSSVVKKSRDFSRLEVPGGYVPFEMTRTETKTKDYVKTETRIKTYIDSDDLPTVLSNSQVEVLTDGEQ